MNPSVDVRLTTMVRAMQDVVLPALEATPGLALEQAQLVLGHLHVLQGQLPYAERFEALELRTAIALGEALAAGAPAGPARQQDDAALATADAEAIRAAVEDLVRDTEDREAQALVRSIVLEHERTAATLNRTWFAAMGWEGPDSGLPSIPQLAGEGRA